MEFRIAKYQWLLGASTYSSLFYLLFCFFCFVFLKRADWHVQYLIWRCLEPWKLDYPTFSYRWTLGSCFGGSGRGAQLLIYIYPLPKNNPSLSGKVILPHQTQFWEGHRRSCERGKRHLPCQPDQPYQPWWSIGWQISEPDHSYILLFVLFELGFQLWLSWLCPLSRHCVFGLGVR